MIQVDVKNNVSGRTVMADEAMTVAQCFDEAGIGYEGFAVSANGMVVPATSMNKPISAFGTGKITLSAIAKRDNA